MNSAGNSAMENNKKIVDKDKNLYHKMNEIKKEKQKFDYNQRSKRRSKGLVFCIIVLVVLAVLNMFSANFYSIYAKGLSVLKTYALYWVVSIFAFIGGACVNHKLYNKNRFCLFLLTISGIFLSFIVFGASAFPSIVPRINGAYGWIRIGGLSLQPAEFLKLPFIILLAHLLERAEKNRLKNFAIIFHVLPILAFYGFFIMWQGDLGTTIHYFVIFAFMLFMSKIDMKWIVGTITLGLSSVAGVCAYVYTLGDLTKEDYKIRRVGSFLTGLLKNEYDNDIGYQVGQSLIAFGSGGIIGKGYANGVQKYSYLPEVKTDFILSSYGEELGFLGMFIIMVLFLTLFNIIKRIGMEAEEYFSKYLAIGIAGYIITQALINMYVALGMLPVFGIPMPLFSYGGSSLVTIFACLGIVININKKR